jgi:hypothetical protein
MMLTKTLPALAALALAGLMTTTAHALPFNYTVASTLNGVTTPAGTPNIVNLGGGNTLTVIADAALNNNVPTDISLATFQLTGGSTSPAAPAAVNFNYALSITDQPSNQTGLFNLAGTFTISNFTPGSAIQDVTFTSPSTQSLVIGGGAYTISTYRFSPDTVNDASSVGGFGLRVDAVSAVPEPSSLALAGIGVAGLAGYGLRRRRRRA